MEKYLHKFSGLTQYKCILLGFRKAEVWSQDVRGGGGVAFFLEASEGLLSWPASNGPLLAFLGLGLFTLF